MAVDLPVLVEKYIKLRDGKAKIKERHKAELERIDAAMDKVEAALLSVMNDQGMEGIRFSGGTVYKSIRTTCSVADWDSTLDWVRTNEAWHMLERRVSKQAAEQYRDEHGMLPPGLNWREEAVVQIRRS